MNPFYPLLLAVILYLPIHAADIVAQPFPPAKFTSLYLEKDEKGTSTIIEATGDSVIYKVTQGGKVIENLTVQPDGDAWFQFVQGLNQAKVYKWADKYWFPGQGTTWVIDLVMEDRKFSSEGANEFPKDGDETQPQANSASGPSVPFQLFWQAALKLVGKGAPQAAPK
jgi:hypothetical protein